MEESEKWMLIFTVLRGLCASVYGYTCAHMSSIIDSIP